MRGRADLSLPLLIVMLFIVKLLWHKMAISHPNCYCKNVTWLKKENNSNNNIDLH